ncbi:MAG: hypothetical protein KJ760_19130 [Proteobacteria bacterium]|nr:hypothetical protein [Pseudomonadota bacterium]
MAESIAFDFNIDDTLKLASAPVDLNTSTVLGVLALNLLQSITGYTIVDLTAPVIVNARIDQAVKNDSSVTLRSDSISDVDSWIEYVDWVVRIERNTVILYDVVIRQNYGESTQELFNPSCTFDLSFILETDDVIVAKILACNAFNRLTIKELTTTVLGVLALNLLQSITGYTIVDLTAPVILDISITDENNNFLQTGDTQVKISARAIYDIGSTLDYVSWAIVINPVDPNNIVVWDYVYEEINPPAEGYYDWAGNWLFTIPVLYVGDVVVGRILARDPSNTEIQETLTVIVEGILTLNLSESQSDYEIFGDGECPIITDVSLTNTLGEFLTVGDSQCKVAANVTDNHILELVILRLYVNYLPWQEISIFDSVQGIKENLFNTSVLIAGDIIYYQAYARDVSGNETETEIFQYIITETVAMPIIRYEAATDINGRDLTENDEGIQVSAIVTSDDTLAEVSLFLWVNDIQQETKILLLPPNGFQIALWPVSFLIAGDKISYKIAAKSLSGGLAESLIYSVYVLANYVEEDYKFSSLIGKITTAGGKVI